MYDDDEDERAPSIITYTKRKAIPIPWLTLCALALVIYFCIRTFSLAAELGFFAWLLDKAIIAFLMGSSIAAMIKVLHFK